MHYLKYAMGLSSVGALIWFLLLGPMRQTDATFSRIACTCSDEVPPREAFELAKKVFAGKVVREEPLTPMLRGKQIEFEVISAWKGLHQQRFTILDDQPCPPNPEVGELWLIHGYESDGDLIRMKTCGGGSRLLAHAKSEDLDYLGDAEWGARRVPRAAFRNESAITTIITHIMSIVPWHYWSLVTIMAVTIGLAIWGIRHGGTV
jgi:hypothetical protein